jgi:DNA-binding CsgD family transcriptional regulator
LFRTLGVFAGGCTLEAARAVAVTASGSVSEVLAGSEALLDRSLLRRATQPGGGLRVDMLETIREYAIEQLTAAGELEGTQQRHADYYLALAEKVANPRLDGPDGPALMADLECDHDNLRAGLRWLVERADAEASLRLAGALWSFWEKRGYWTEGIRWQQTALALAGNVSTAARADALMGLAVMHRERSEYAVAAKFCWESVEVQRQLNDQSNLPGSLTILADLVAPSGDPHTGGLLAAEATTLRRDDPVANAWSLLVQGYIAAYEAEFGRAKQYYEMGLNVRRGQGGNEVDANLLHGLGAILAGADDVTAARPLLEQALGLFRARGEARAVARVLLSLGALLARQGDGALARATLEESLALFRTLGEAVGMALCSLMLGLPLPEGMLAELGDGALRKWWRLSLGRDAPLASDLAAWRIIPDRPAAPRDQATSDANGLTRRELEVLALIARQYSNRQIAAELVLSVRTVERHITNIYAKTGLSSRGLAETYAANYVNT